METNVSFRVHKDELADAVSWVARSLPTKTTQPVLRAVVITADDNGLEFAGFDYEVSSRVRIGAEVNEPGRVAVAGKLLSDIVGTMPSDAIEVTTDGKVMTLKARSSRFELPLVPLDDYPQLPTLPEVTGKISPAALTGAVTQVAAAAGRDDTLPMLTGIHVEIEGENVKLTATDRFRLAQRHLTWEPAAPGVQADLLIPAKTLLDNARTLDTSLDEPVEIAVGAGDGDDLALAAGEVGGIDVHVGDVDAHREQLFGADPAHLRLAQHAKWADKLLAEEEVAPDAELVDDGQGLVHGGDAGVDRVAGGGEGGRMVVDKQLARCGLVQPREDLDQGGFAGAVVAEDARDFAGAHGEVDAAQRLEGAVVLCDAAKLDDRH